MQVPPPSFVAVNGRKIAYDEVAPESPAGTVLLISGLGAKRLGWYKQLAVFGTKYRTIALDNRDIGDSDLADAPYRTGDQADDAAALLRALGVERAAVVGISMGGFIALELALRHPDLVEKLVLTSTSAGGKTHMQPGWRMRLMLGMPRYLPRWLRPDAGTVAKRSYAAIMAPGYCAAHPDEWEHIGAVALYRPQPAAAYLRQLGACLTHNAGDRLGQIAVPTLVIHGTVDPLVPPANGEYLAAHIPGARLIRYPATGHVPIIERADDYNRDVLAFLAE